VCFPFMRIHGIGPQDNESGPTFSPALFYPRPEQVERVFAGIGAV